MKNNNTILFLCVTLLVVSFSCVAPQRKSEKYYYENESKIKSVVKKYDSLYDIKPFSIGFTDKSFEYITVEVETDTIRYAFNNETGEEYLYKTITHFDYDTSLMISLLKEMRSIECLWLGKSYFYFNDRKEDVTFLSFKSISINKPFQENKYYMLAFFDENFVKRQTKKRFQKYNLQPIKDNVFYTISDQFR